MLEPPAGQISVIQTHIHQARAYTLYTPLSISCMIRAGTTCMYSIFIQSYCLNYPVYVESTQHVLCNTCSLARSQWYLNLNLYPLSHPRPRPHPQTAQPQTTQLYIKGIANLFVKGLTTLLQEILRFNVNSRSCPKK